MALLNLVAIVVCGLGAIVTAMAGNYQLSAINTGLLVINIVFYLDKDGC